MTPKKIKRLFKLIHSMDEFKNLTEVKSFCQNDDSYIMLVFGDEYFSVLVTGCTDLEAIRRVFDLLDRL